MTFLGSWMLSCNQIEKSFQDTFKGENKVEMDTVSNVVEVVEEKEKINFLSDSMALKSAQNQLENLPEFQGQKLMFRTAINFYADGRIKIELQNPKTPEYLDQYWFENDRWQQPTPVVISASDDFKKELFPLSEIDFSTASKIYDKANDFSKNIDGAKPITYLFFMYRSRNQLKEWHGSIGGTREQYLVTANKKADKINFERK